MKLSLISIIGLAVFSCSLILTSKATSIDQIEVCKNDLLDYFKRLNFNSALAYYEQKLRNSIGDPKKPLIKIEQHQVVSVKAPRECNRFTITMQAAFEINTCKELEFIEFDKFMKNIEANSTFDRYIGIGRACLMSKYQQMRYDVAQNHHLVPTK